MKNYVKPELFYERYEVSQHIADCAWEWKNNTNVNDCRAEADSLKLPGYPNLFLNRDNGCDNTNPVQYENYCYQPGADGIKLHMS